MKRKPRTPEAVAARARKSGTMKHRLEPKGGSKNEEWDDHEEREEREEARPQVHFLDRVTQELSSVANPEPQELPGIGAVRLLAENQANVYEPAREHGLIAIVRTAEATYFEVGLVHVNGTWVADYSMPKTAEDAEAIISGVSSSAAVNWEGIARFLGQPEDNVQQVRETKLVPTVVTPPKIPKR